MKCHVRNQVSVYVQVTIYSRNCENKTAMFPDVCTCILQACRYSEVKRSFIVDSELVAVDRANGNRLRAFQDLSTRCSSLALHIYCCTISLLLESYYTLHILFFTILLPTHFFHSLCVDMVFPTACNADLQC